MNEITIDCANISDALQLHRVLFEALPLPLWYGHNLDALFDSLTVPGQPMHLILLNWNSDAPHSKGFESVFADAAAENADFTYTIKEA